MILAFLCLIVVGAAFMASVPFRIAMLDGARVRYQSFGKGPRAVVLVHGWICDHSFWIRNIPALNAEYRVIALDLPGHGGSDGPKVEYTQQYFAKALDAVLKDAKVSRAVLVGHNMGAPVARQFLADFPAKVSGMILVDAAISTPLGPDEMEQRKARRRPFLESLRTAAYPEIAEKFIDRMFVTETPPDLRARIKPRMLATPQWISVSAMEGMSDGSMWAPVTDVPTLCIYSDKGRKAENDAMLAGMFSNVDHQEWPGGGNFTMMEMPDRFNAAVLEFLKTIGF
ncbi:MAG: alpha/beta hydrolase [Bryobacteraceae bacterium]